MIFGKSVKYVLRTPATTALFMVLFAVAAFFVSSGAVIWARNQTAVKAYESTFLTIGTVRQSAAAIEITKRWDAYKKDYVLKSALRYSEIIPPSVLGVEGIEYIIPPERLPYYGAWRPDLKMWPDDTRHRALGAFVVEATPLEDCVPDGPVDVLVERVLSGDMDNMAAPLKPGDVIPLCDHYNDAPQPLYAGKTYLMHIRESAHVLGAYAAIEYAPPQANILVFSNQRRTDGTRMADSITSPAILEVTDGFYETDIGKLWQEFADTLYNSYKTIPVLPTNETHLLLPFYNGAANIVEGEGITPEEYEVGKRVCLIPEGLANINGISPGDALRLPLYYSDYENAPIDRFSNIDFAYMSGVFEWDIGAPLTSEGKPYTVFSDHEYTVKGIYSNGTGKDPAYAMGINTVVIPAKSVRESDKDNILAYGPMKDTTTTFQIPNGSIEAFMEKWLAQGNDDLEFTFHDRGYTQLRRGLDNMKRVSMLFLAIGSAMSLALMFFFCHVFISKNKLRTAIERTIGYTKKQCVVSLLSGFLITAALAVAVGCAAGAIAEGRITDRLASQEYYSTKYTIGPIRSGGVELEEDTVSALFSPAAGLALLALTGLVSVAFVRGNVKQEPLMLLSGRKE
jgi:hypothetical protein